MRKSTWVLPGVLALAVAEINGCGYCLSAHTYLGRNVAKLDDAPGRLDPQFLDMEGQNLSFNFLCRGRFIARARSKACLM